MRWWSGFRWDGRLARVRARRWVGRGRRLRCRDGRRERGRLRAGRRWYRRLGRTRRLRGLRRLGGPGRPRRLRGLGRLWWLRRTGRFGPARRLVRGRRPVDARLFGPGRVVDTELAGRRGGGAALPLGRAEPAAGGDRRRRARHRTRRLGGTDLVSTGALRGDSGRCRRRRGCRDRDGWDGRCGDGRCGDGRRRPGGGWWRRLPAVGLPPRLGERRPRRIGRGPRGELAGSTGRHRRSRARGRDGWRGRSRWRCRSRDRGCGRCG